jgi:hypothetical protein
MHSGAECHASATFDIYRVTEAHIRNEYAAEASTNRLHVHLINSFDPSGWLKRARFRAAAWGDSPNAGGNGELHLESVSPKPETKCTLLRALG